MFNNMYCRKTLLFNNSNPWVKKSEHNSLFDVAMGANDSAEICELVGLYILNLVKDKFQNYNLDFGLYRDDGLGCYKKIPGHNVATLEKEMHKLFKSLNLKIQLVTEQQQVDFLDVTFNITNNKFWPFRKPNSEILYVNKNSNHPNNIKKELPVMVNKRLNDISCDIEEFNKVKNDYEDALRKSGFKNKLIYKNVQKVKRKRKRKIIWFNPPFDSNVHTNIGKKIEIN